MRIARVLSMLLAILAAGLSVAPAAAAEPPFRLQTQVTDNAGVLSVPTRADVEAAVDKLYDDKRIQLWVVYVDGFLRPERRWAWAQSTMQRKRLR